MLFYTKTFLKYIPEISVSCLNNLLIFISISIAVYACKTQDDVQQVTRTTFQVKGRFLLDPCGDTIILKGINKMSVFDTDDPYGENYFPEIAKTKANCVRIVWQTVYDTGKPARLGQLDTLIRNCMARQMIPMVELHDATCDLSQLNTVLNYWTQPQVVQLIGKYKHALLINIANEAGDDTVTESQFVQAYMDAISRLRNAGIQTPLIIDAPDCGKNLDILLNTSSQLIAHDPEHNLLFSVHPYWSKVAIEQFATPTFIKDQLQKAVTANIPLILGELCGYGGWPGNNVNYVESCTAKGAIDYQTLMQECQKYNIGWLLWEWGPGNGYYEFNPPVLCPTMDITTNRTYSSILSINANAPNAWAKDAVIESPNSIQNTAVKTPFLLNHFSCK